MTRRSGAVVALLPALLFSAVPCLRGQSASNPYTPSQDEQKIRSLIGDGSLRLPMADDVYFVSGAYAHPLIGSSALRGGPPLARHNERSTSTTDRLVVAPSGDMAYEYGHGHIAFDDEQGQHASFDTVYLRVWRKDAGQWKVAAFSARPDPPAKK